MLPAERIDEVEFTVPSVTDEQLAAAHRELDDVIRYQKGSRYRSRVPATAPWKTRRMPDRKGK